MQELTFCVSLPGSKMVGWQLCSNISYPISPMGITLPPPGPAHLSLRLLKLDRGLHQYLLEASYSLLRQVGAHPTLYGMGLSDILISV